MTKIFYSFFTFFFLEYFINCDDSCQTSCLKTDEKCIDRNSLVTCNSKCRPNYLDSQNNGCNYCEGVTTTKKYYYFTSSGCETYDSCGDSFKLVYNSDPSQCVKSCGENLYEMEDFCYSDCIGGNRIEVGASSKKCKCRYLFYKELYLGKTINRCLDQGELCVENNHSSYDFDTNECLENPKCANTKKSKLIYITNTRNITRCSFSCLEDEYVNGKTCVEECPKKYYKIVNNVKTCVTSCKKENLYSIGYLCVNITLCKYITEKGECLQICEQPNCIYNNSNILYCVNNVYNNKTYNDRYGNKICIENCPSKFVKYGNAGECEFNTEKCYYRGTYSKENKICYDKCRGSYLYHNDGEFRCYKNCNINSKFKYHKEDDYICYSSCDLIPGIGDKYYNDNFVCRCLFYDSTNKICYNSELDCIEKKLNYIEGNKCKDSCSINKPYKVKYTIDGKDFYKCYNKTECIENSYYYYNLDSNNGECWVKCLGNKYANENNTDYKPKEDRNGNTCTSSCSDDFPKLSNGVCKSRCSQNEYFTEDEPNKCINECNSDYTHISENNECLKSCTQYTLPQDIGKPRCVSDCATYNKYSLQEDKNCYNSCFINNTQYKFDEGFKCVSTCPEERPYSYNNICSKKPTDKFYYSNKTIVDKCDPLLFSSSDRNQCIDSCGNNEKIYENHCYLECPFEAPYFITDNKGIKKCVLECGGEKKIIEFTKECVDECNSNDFEIIGKKCYRKCTGNYYLNPETGDCIRNNCPNNFPYFEKKMIGGTNIQICKSSCDEEKKYILDKECVENCRTNNNNYIGIDNKCKSNCESSKGETHSIFLGKFDGIETYKCSKSCQTDSYNFYTSNNHNQCYNKCPNDGNRYLVVEGYENNYECRTQCPDDYPYFYTQDKNDNYNYIPCTNIFKCENYFKNGDCDEGCMSNNFIQKKICENGCDIDQGFKYIRLNENINIFECSKFCESNEYIEKYKEDERLSKCVKTCSKENKFIGNDKNCIPSCSSEEGEYFYPLSEQSDYTIYKCTKSCSNSSYPLILDDSINHLCLDKCPSNYKYLSKNENKCYSDCKNSPRYKYTLDEEGKEECLFECNSTFPYYYENEKKCRVDCENGDFAVEFKNECISYASKKCKDMNYYAYEKEGNNDKYKVNTCVIQCPLNKPYALERDGDIYCGVKCSEEKKFFIREFKHFENNLQKICMPNCPLDYPYYTIYNDDNDNKAYGCQNTCDEGYLALKDGKTLCIPECPDTTSTYKNEYDAFKYRIVDQNNNKFCYEECPEGLYHKEGGGSYCLSICPDDAPFHEFNGIICKKENEVSCNYINYEKKECTENDQDCSNIRKYTSKSKATNKYICTDECNTTYGIYETPYKTCVNDCSNDELVKDLNLINDNQNKKCICKNLHYYDKEKNDELICFENKFNNRKCKYLHSEYIVNIYGSNECIKKDDCTKEGKILSPSKDVCYMSNNCEDIDKNFVNEYQHQCKCKYKYYKKAEDESCNYEGCDPTNLDLNITICLDEKGVCPLGYEKYIPGTGECVSQCPDDYYSFRNFCLSETECSGNFEKVGKLCKCTKGFWFIEDIDGVNKLNCVENCDGAEYPLYAPDVSESECLKSCSGTYYPYFYNNKCYSSCANNDLLDIINGFEVFESPENPDLSKYMCDCLNPWYYDNTKKKKICSDSIYPDSISDCNNFTSHTSDFKYMVKHTLECRIDDCPDEYPFHFNNECFKDCENDAASFYHYLKTKDNSNDECECINLWFINSINKSECLEIDVNECIKFNYDLKYKINSTRQCVSECPSDMWAFNYVCYNECPENTTKSATGNTCICDTSLGYWYEYKKDNGTYLKCALDECPKENDENNITHVRKNLVEEKSQCLISCSNDDKYKFALRDICREDCPYFMDINEEKDECIFFDLNNEINITNLTLLKEAANIQTKELYESSKHLGGYLFNKFNSSLHIYAININNSLTNISFKSNLTYIDLGTCLKKIFSSNEIYLNENFSILVAKYDLLTDTINDYSKSKISEKDKYLINKVEYELFSSNMSEKLEMNGETCDPYELIISYPLTLNRFNIYEGGLNKNELRKKFEIGKKLHLRDNNIDTFNINNTVYKNFCRSLEIDGKDLVFEDRYKYLYPNNKVLCESNCIMNNTNFELERIVCLCSYKEEFVLNREDEAVDIFNDPNFEVPTQSCFNAEAVKCLFNFTLNETIFYNEAFYYTSVVMAAKLAMIFVTSFSGVKNLAASIKHILSKLNLNKNFGKRSYKTKRIKFKNENVISTTGRALNNPPKKSKYNEKYNEDIDLDSDDGDNNINNTILENEEEDKDEEVVNYEINIKKIVKPDIKDNKDIFYDKKNKNKNSSDNKNIKAEYIPPDYNFKFFRPKDKGLMKKIERSEIPFDINPDTNYLIERRKGIDYPEDYLDGPYFPEQNIIIVTDSKNKDPLKVAKYLKDEKIMKKKLNMTDNKSSNEDKSNNKSFKGTKYNINEKTKNSFYPTQKIGEKSFMSIKKINPYENLDNNGKNILDELDENNETKEIDDDTSIFALIRREHLFLRVKYETYIKKIHPYYLYIFFAEIFDKIYIFKILFFLRQSDIFSVHFSLYVFCHILLLALLCNLFTVKIIKKIWETTDFPDIEFYLLYGLISNAIIWVIYQLFSFLIDFEGQIRELIAAKNNMQKKAKSDEDSISESNENMFYKKFSCLMCLIRLRVSIFHIITFSIALCCGLYLISFFALYTGTKSLVLKIYYISIVEILLIKIVYGVILASLRIVSKEAKLKALYVVIYILDKYLS